MTWNYQGKHLGNILTKMLSMGSQSSIRGGGGGKEGLNDSTANGIKKIIMKFKMEIKINNKGSSSKHT